MHVSKASPRRHIVHAVVILIVIRHAIVVSLPCKVIVHMQAVPIKRFVDIVLRNLQTLNDIVSLHLISSQG